MEQIAIKFKFRLQLLIWFQYKS